MNNDTENPDEIDLREIFINLWREKWLVLAVTFVFSICGVVYALLSQPIYRSEALLMVKDDGKSGGGLSALAGQLGGLAGIASSENASKKDIAMATLKSRLMIEGFLLEKKLLPILFAEQWDDAKEQWIDADPKKNPTLQDGYKYFSKEILKYSEDKKSGLITLAVEWSDARQASEWVSELVRRTNQVMQVQAIQESERNIAYLKAQSLETSVVELQNAIYNLMEGELKKIMIAKGGEDYAFQVIDPPQVPEKKIRPKRAVIVVLSFMLGAFAGVFLVLVKKALRTEQKPAASNEPITLA